MAREALDAGSRFDAYEILALLARGGMANVWLGRQHMKHGLETLVAIKTILPEYSLDPKFQTMFLDEARIACRVDHPNVARLLDVGEAFGHSYIVMEYVGGESLSRLRRTFARAGKNIPVGIVMRVLADLCAGLHAAHELRGTDGALLNVVHRDVSPQNILLSDNGIVKLIDFGVAKARGRLGSETSAGFAKGKARYMAPEQAGGLDADRRADVWAVGAVLYELLAGRTPMDGPNEMAVLKNLLADARVEPLAVSVPEPVRAIAERALSRAPEDRYASAADMRDAFESAMAELDLRTTAADVERTVREHLAERIGERKQSIEAALRAADDRNQSAAVRVIVGEESSTDLPRPPAPSDASVAASTKSAGLTRGARRWPIVAAIIAASAAASIFAIATHAQKSVASPSSGDPASVHVASAASVATPIASEIAPAAASVVASAIAEPSAAPSASHAHARTHGTARPSRSTHDWGGIE
jgi:serine/threonine protein kinase